MYVYAYKYIQRYMLFIYTHTHTDRHKHATALRGDCSEQATPKRLRPSQVPKAAERRQSKALVGSRGLGAYG